MTHIEPSTPDLRTMIAGLAVLAHTGREERLLQPQRPEREALGVAARAEVARLAREGELDAQSVILTLDSDFRVYRRNRRQVIPTIMPGRSGR